MAGSSGIAPAPSDTGEDQFNIEGMTADEVLKEFNARIKASKTHLSDWRAEYRDLHDMEAGRQWEPADEAQMQEDGRPAVTFNLFAKFIDMLIGLQINNRQDIRYFPREQGDAQKNEMLTSTVEWIRDLCEASSEETDAFHDAMLAGLGWVEWYLDRFSEPQMLPAGERRDPLEMYYDPKARKKGLVDRRWQARMRSMTRAEYRELFDEEPTGVALDEAPDLSLDDEDDSDPKIIPANHDYPDRSSSAADRETGGTIVVADYQFWRVEKGIQVKAVLPGEQSPTDQFFTKAEWSKIEPVLRSSGAAYQATAGVRKRFYRCFVTPDGVKKAGPSPSQSGFTIHAITGKRDRNRNTWYGVGRSLKDPSRWVNKFFSSILYTLMTNAKGGLLAEEGAFVDKRRAEADWAKANSITYVADGALANARIKDKPPATYPQGMDRLMQFSVEALPAVSGLNLEIMGMADRVQPGVVEAQRKQSAMAIVAWAFDAMRLYYRLAGRQIAQYVADYVPAGTLVRVNGENGAQYVPLLKDKLNLPFDVIVDEAPTSVNMRERVWLVLESLIPQLLQAGIPIPKEVIDYSPLPADLQAKWKETMQPDPQAQQMQQAGAQAELEKTKAEGAEKQASAQLKQAQAAHVGAQAEHEPLKAVKTAAEAGALQAGD